MNTLLLNMSIAGSISFLIYLAIKHLLKKWVTASQRYMLLKICLFFYLIPAALCSREIKVRLCNAFDLRYPEIHLGVPERVTPFDRVIYKYGQQLTFAFPRYLLVILCIWAIVSFLILFFQLRSYGRFRNTMKNVLHKSTEYASSVDQLCQELSIKSTVKVYSSPEAVSAFTFGIRNSKIVLPPKLPAETAVQIAKHELIHIKYRDVLFKLLTLAAVIVHFYNPLIYLFWREFDRVCELHCDECLLKNSTDEERITYGRTLLHFLSKGPDLIYGNCFKTNNKKWIKERLTMIKHPKKNRRLISVLAFLALFLCGGISALAYESPQIIETEKKEAFDSISLEGTAWLEPSRDPSKPYAEDEVLFAYTDAYLLYGNGQTEIIDGGNMQPRATCNHNYINCTYKKHVKNTSGGCTVYEYAAKQCTKCGNIVVGQLSVTLTYTVCIH